MNDKNETTRLLSIFESLNEARKNGLLEYAEFLQAKGDLQTKEVAPAVAIDRPEEETVVGAIKRLKLTYPMVENMRVFSAASSLMTEHMVNSRDAMAVIDDMENLFEEAYQSLLQDNK